MWIYLGNILKERSWNSVPFGHDSLGGYFSVFSDEQVRTVMKPQKTLVTRRIKIVYEYIDGCKVMLHKAIFQPKILEFLSGFRGDHCALAKRLQNVLFSSYHLIVCNFNWFFFLSSCASFCWYCHAVREKKNWKLHVKKSKILCGRLCATRNSYAPLFPLLNLFFKFCPVARAQ